MASDAVVFSWGANVVGREAMGLGVFMAAVQYFAERKSKGEIEDVRVYISDQGSLSKNAGHMIVEGSADQMAALTKRDEYQKLVIKAFHVVNDFRVCGAITGDAIPKRIELLQVTRKELGI